METVTCAGGSGRCACSEQAGSATVLDEAAAIVDGPRREKYGHPKENHGATAAFWTTYLRRRGLLADGAELDGRDVCWMNVFQKGSRDAHVRQRDNLVDGAGFLRNAEIVSDA